MRWSMRWKPCTDRLALALLFANAGAALLQPQRVAVVTGASRGIGKGIAVELGREGYAVVCVGRSSRTDAGPTTERPTAEADLTVEATAEAVTAAGGRGRALPCDLGQDGAVDAIMDEVAQSEGRLDVLVSSAYTTPPGRLRGPFWEQPMAMWDSCNGVGLRGAYATCRAAAPHMIRTAAAAGEAPLICLVSSFGGKAYTFNVAYGVGKAAVDRLASDMAFQLKPHGVASISLYPGVVKTEGNLEMERRGEWAEASGGLDLEAGESPAFSGRAVAALARLDSEAMLARSGRVEVVAELARELGFSDIDGSRPPSIRSLAYLCPNFVFPSIEAGGGTVPRWVRDNVPDINLPWSIFASPPPDRDASPRSEGARSVI